MATKINNARIVEQVYEFGVDWGDGVEWYPSYDEAKSKSETFPFGQLKMRAIYKTEWMDAN